MNVKSQPTWSYTKTPIDKEGQRPNCEAIATLEERITALELAMRGVQDDDDESIRLESELGEDQAPPSVAYVLYSLYDQLKAALTIAELASIIFDDMNNEELEGQLDLIVPHVVTAKENLGQFLAACGPNVFSRSFDEEE